MLCCNLPAAGVMAGYAGRLSIYDCSLLHYVSAARCAGPVPGTVSSAVRWTFHAVPNSLRSGIYLDNHALPFTISPWLCVSLVPLPVMVPASGGGFVVEVEVCYMVPRSGDVWLYCSRSLVFVNVL